MNVFPGALPHSQRGKPSQVSQCTVVVDLADTSKRLADVLLLLSAQIESIGLGEIVSFEAGNTTRATEQSSLETSHE
ncbi:hypothetical protein [Pseudomonas ficuserectae]|uniref:hypothetical protein n=1 Tax=Pseudomonas ficuserectae TaxID=53410 RepID=UPI0006D5F354|nr:hypothetical protein [Pseudomonas ficuserectae]KPX35930.1 hypothetical protein ALO69_200030 [Pseudomonas ficuserectae]RMS38529.1 hypothetical protein ALP68_200236 [Pseudomonas ficuserectae]RMS41931.1 hypothetical protein ALP67_03686 [Pseudomonas ficuserectae]